jgi:GNAT superfamily N-acetyltransferase
VALIDAETLAEKLRPPRALTAVGSSLYAAPAPGSVTAWLSWWSGAPGELAEVVARARVDGAARLAVGGPPGNYVESGVDASDRRRVAALRAAGFVRTGEHRDLRVRTQVIARVTGEPVARGGAELVERIRSAFGAAWAWEAERAVEGRGLFVALADDGAWQGFAAHSGNLAHRGTFGPIGVLPTARGRGVGGALATAVLNDLRARGFEEATVPWVSTETVAFYRGLAELTGETRRLTMALGLERRGEGAGRGSGEP